MHVLIPLLLLAACQSGSTPEAALRHVDEKTLKEHVAVLASDAYEGRAAGFPGNEKAVAYLVAQAKDLGLKPAGTDGYVQEFTFRGGRKAKNVIAVWEGTDLKDRYVMIGAHLDHVGTADQRVGGQGGRPTEDDRIWNGADDNGSGTSTCLAVAKGFTRSGLRARRSILFCWWNAEEAGLLGSRHWTREPTLPLERVVYCLNVDMIGRNPQRPVDVEGSRNAEGLALEKILTSAFDAEGAAYTLYPHYNEAMFRSDGVNLLRQGIPASMLFTYWHADYHRVGDHAEKLAYPRLAKIARASLRILYAIADREEPLRLNTDTPLKDRPLRVGGEDLKGETLKQLELGEGHGGARIYQVDPAGQLGKAGLKVNDLLVGFAGPLPAEAPLVEVWRRAQGLAPDEAATVEVLRGSERVSFPVTWPGRKRK